jgi:hypothetical protein
LSSKQAVHAIALVTLAAGLGSLLLPALGVAGALVVAAQTTLILGVVAILETSNGPILANDRTDIAFENTSRSINHHVPADFGSLRSDAIAGDRFVSSDVLVGDTNALADAPCDESIAERETNGFAIDGERPDGQK